MKKNVLLVRNFNNKTLNSNHRSIDRMTASHSVNLSESCFRSRFKTYDLSGKIHVFYFESSVKLLILIINEDYVLSSEERKFYLTDTRLNTFWKASRIELTSISLSDATISSNPLLPARIKDIIRNVNSG